MLNFYYLFTKTMNHSSKQQSMNQLRKNERSGLRRYSLQQNQDVVKIVAWIMRVWFEVPGSVFVTDEDVARLPDFFQVRLHEISWDSWEYDKYARVSMVSGFAMVQILEKYFRDKNLVLPIEASSIDQKIEEVLWQLWVRNCLPSEKWRSIVWAHLEELDTYVFAESLYTALYYVLLNNNFEN